MPVGKARQPGRLRPVPALAPKVWFEASRFSSAHDLQAQEQGQGRVPHLLDPENSVAVRTPPAPPAEAFRRDREWVVRRELRRPERADRRDELRRLAVRDSRTFRGKKKAP
jgi:hypothetical protein